MTGRQNLLDQSTTGQTNTIGRLTRGEDGLIVRKEMEQTFADTKISRAGTRGVPYERKKDGKKTQKISFVGESEFATRLDIYTRLLPAKTSRNRWIQRVLTDAMDRRIGQDDYAGPR